MDKHNIGVVTFPMYKSGNQPLSNLMDIIVLWSEETSLVTGNDGYTLFRADSRFNVSGTDHTPGKFLVSRIFRYLCTQVRVSYLVLQRTPYVDKWIFFFGGTGLLLPLLITKMYCKRTALLRADGGVRLAEASQDPLSFVLKAVFRLTHTLSDKVILYSPGLINEWDLENYRHKVLIAHEHFLNFDAFNVITPLSNRPPLIGYIGRLSREKGVGDFARALPAILGDRQDLRVLIGGDGELKEMIEATLQEEGVAARANLPGWISHEDLPNYLNQLRLLVLPSYTEGLPNIMLEAMACGTPVLATPVGAIPDIIVDGITGFIMENNAPECIAENVMRALNSPELEQIAENGRRFVGENFSFESTAARWKAVLEEI
ncbi:glycosyltransferase family 4 protein [Methanoculleus oceani]|uniref:Glycosyl transferase family 1 domain-containing protein n=1 Tax=Methanoculleus oceani TaxID=2184756 RepID=A0ABD4TB17_9EURY|nr:glycosyltransferase family 4 protein [Methanoculleus sp. CWC-02]MCM2465813.1 hypothetical protein [Methanoculleus sp. CWC-02]